MPLPDVEISGAFRHKAKAWNRLMPPVLRPIAGEKGTKRLDCDTPHCHAIVKHFRLNSRLCPALRGQDSFMEHAMGKQRGISCRQDVFVFDRSS